MIICNCKRCGYEWASRKISPPIRCAKCTALNWTRPKRVSQIKKTPNRVGRPTKYPVHVLNVGQSMTLPIEGVNVETMRQSIDAYGRRHNRRFDKISVIGGLKVHRTQ